MSVPSNTPRLHEDRDWFMRRYVEDDRTYRELAEEAGCGLRTIARWVRIHGFSVADPHEKRERRGNTRRGPRLPPSLCACGSRKTRVSATCMSCYDRTGDKNPKWRGDSIGNPQAHGRVKKARGLAKTHQCAHCDKPAAHWAYDHADPDERQHEEGPYSLDVAHYMPLCVPCHKRFDLDHLSRTQDGADDVRVQGHGGERL